MTQAACSYQVLIIGAGPAGLAAGLYTARYGLRTLIVDAGKSLLRQCAYLDNYLGFPGGIDAESWLEGAPEVERWIAHTRTQRLTAAGIQARRTRATSLRERVLSEARGPLWTRRLA